MTQNETPLDRMARLKQEEEDRVAALIKRDKGHRIKERERKAAEIDLENGKTVSIDAAVVEPTPEWLEKGETRSFVPKLEDGTVKTVRAHRRVLTPVVVKLERDGKITEDQARAALWYREMYDASGIEGNCASAGISLTSGISKSPSGAFGHMAKTEYEAYARQQFRAAREEVEPGLRRFLDAVAVDDIPLHRAAKFARCRKERAGHHFRQCANALVRYCEKTKTDLSKPVDYA